MPLHNPPSGVNTVKKVSSPVQATTSISAQLATLVCAENLDRTYLSLFNAGESRVYIGDTSTVTDTDFFFFIEPNGFYETYVVCPTHDFYAYSPVGSASIHSVEYSD